MSMLMFQAVDVAAIVLGMCLVTYAMTGALHRGWDALDRFTPFACGLLLIAVALVVGVAAEVAYLLT